MVFVLHMAGILWNSQNQEKKFGLFHESGVILQCQAIKLLV